MVSAPYGLSARHPNLSNVTQRYLNRLNASVEDLFHHVHAVLHNPTYRAANAGALRMEWSRIPLPGWPDGDAADAAKALTQSATRGRELVQLLDPDTPIPGVTQGNISLEIAAIAVPATTDGCNMAGTDFVLTAGWGHYGTGGTPMPGQGCVEERAFTPDEQATFSYARNLLANSTDAERVLWQYFRAYLAVINSAGGRLLDGALSISPALKPASSSNWTVGSMLNEPNTRETGPLGFGNKDSGCCGFGIRT